MLLQPMERTKIYPVQEVRFETVTMNEYGEIVFTTQHTTQQYIEDLGNDVTLEMISVPGGTFLIGSPKSEPERYDDESPQHIVTVSPFLMGKSPVTQAQWQTITGNNPSAFKGANRPVERVSWDDVQEFLRTLNARSRKGRYRLPTEAEWEYACRARTIAPFYFGATITPEFVNYDGTFPYGTAPQGEYRRQTTAVGSFPPNAFGLYDMHGNVWEWCQDWYGPYSKEAVADPQGPAMGAYRIYRGGSWFYAAGNCRSANRVCRSPAGNFINVGFRLVRTPLSS